MDRVQEDLKLLNVRDTEEYAKDGEKWRQYVVADMSLKVL